MSHTGILYYYRNSAGAAVLTEGLTGRVGHGAVGKGACLTGSGKCANILWACEASFVHYTLQTCLPLACLCAHWAYTAGPFLFYPPSPAPLPFVRPEDGRTTTRDFCICTGWFAVGSCRLLLLPTYYVCSTALHMYSTIILYSLPICSIDGSRRT
jgi:hypothetical protein